MVEPFSCVFCGGSKRSDEHVIPQWYSNLRNPEQRPFFAPPITWNPIDGHRERRHAQQRSKVITVKTRNVCETCNKGWLKQELEDPMRDLFLRLVSPETTGITETDRVLAASWAYKTMTLFDVVREGADLSGATLRNCRGFYEHRVPPSMVSLVLGGFTGNGRPARYDRHNTMQEHDGFDTAVVGVCRTLFLPPLIFQLLTAVDVPGHPMLYQLHDGLLSGTFKSALLPLWPRQLDREGFVGQWPPSYGFDVEALMALTYLLYAKPPDIPPEFG